MIQRRSFARFVAPALAAFATLVTTTASARADPDAEPLAGSFVSRPLTLPKGQLAVYGSGGVLHEASGTLAVGSGLGAAYGITDRFQVDLNALSFQYTPTVRYLGPSGAATYELLAGRVQMGVRFDVGGVFRPTPGALLQPSLPTHVALTDRLRLEVGPQLPIVVAKQPIVGLVAPLGVTAQITYAIHAHAETAAAVDDLAHARSISMPLRFSVGYVVRTGFDLDIEPFFAFPKLFTPGDVPVHTHSNIYVAGLGFTGWFHP